MIKIEESIMTTGIDFESVLRLVTDGSLGSVVNTLITQCDLCPYQTSVDTAMAINAVVKGNSAIARACSPDNNDHLVIKIIDKYYDLNTGKQVKSGVILDDVSSTANTYYIEDLIRRLVKSNAMDGTNK